MRYVEEIAALVPGAQVAIKGAPETDEAPRSPPSPTDRSSTGDPRTDGREPVTGPVRDRHKGGALEHPRATRRRRPGAPARARPIMCA